MNDSQEENARETALMRVLLRTLGYALVAVTSSVVTAVVLSGGHLAGPSRRLRPLEIDLSYSDFVSVLLTVLAVILAALTIGVAIVAFRTIKDIKEDARSVAVKHATTVIQERTENLPAQVETVVAFVVKEKLPSVMQKNVREVIEEMAKNGKLGQALDEAYLRMAAFDTETEGELQPSFEGKSATENDNGKS